MDISFALCNYTPSNLKLDRKEQGIVSRFSRRVQTYGLERTSPLFSNVVLAEKDFGYACHGS